MSEMKYTLVEKLGFPKSKVKAHNTRISGLVAIRIIDVDDPRLVVERLKALEDDEHYFMHTLKIKPVMETGEADYEVLKELASKVALEMDGSYRITISKRHSSMQRDMIIEVAASVITNKVDLTNYDWELIVEVLGDSIGVSAVPRDGVYSTRKAHEVEETDYWFLDEE